MALDFKTAFANLSKKQRIALIGGSVVVVLGLYGYFLIYPMWEEKGKLEGDLEKLQADLRQKQLIAANRPKLDKEIKDLEAKLQQVLVRLPEEKDIPRLLTQVNTLGQQNGLEFLLFRPSAPVRRGFYADVPIDIRVEGQYHTVGGFLDKVSKLERIVNVSDFRVTPLSAQAQQQKSGRTIIVDMKATTFTFLEKGGAPSAPAKK
ncbi:MAG: type 4a pilus biogenesis protein PilO [candidate division NC10 bacterium]|nr:type 4a pilus biogenesis protein PilO [candidate division NC10 bacterium]